MGRKGGYWVGSVKYVKGEFNMTESTVIIGFADGTETIGRLIEIIIGEHVRLWVDGREVKYSTSVIGSIEPIAPITATLDLYHWYTIRHSLALVMDKLINEDTGDAEELERQRIEECTYTQNLQARIGKIIADEEERLGITPIKVE